jgi:hypothetical protein
MSVENPLWGAPRIHGELLTIEATMMPGKGKMTVTGNLRDVMKESISAAAAYVCLRPRLRRFVPRLESIHADMAAELALASSGMMTPFPCEIFLAYNICAGLTGLGVTFPAVSPSAFLGACSFRNFRQIDIDVL